MGAPLVTVGIPTYNRPVQLAGCLAHVLQQTYQNLEILISDNHSTDQRVAEILAEFASKDNRIRYVIQETNIEAEPNFNYVFNHAKGEYFIWLSDDDYFQENYIESCVNFLMQHDDYVSCAGISSYSSAGKVVEVEKGFSLEDDHRLKRFWNYFYHVTKNGIFYGVFKRDRLSENPIGKYVGSDWSVVATLALQGKIKVLNHILMHRSLDGGSASRGSMTKRWKLNKFNTLFFETYIATQLCSNVFNDKKGASVLNASTQICLKAGLFIFLNFKFLLYAIRRRM